MNDQLPSSVDAEKTVLGAILLDNEYFFDETAELEPDDFSLDANRRIYLKMNQILFGEVEGVTTVDPVTLCNELQRQGEIEAVGGWAYVASLTDGLPRKIVLGNYIRILKEKTKLRKIMLTCNAAYARAADQQDKAEVVTSFLTDELLKIGAEGADHVVGIAEIDIEKSLNEKRNVSQERTALQLTWGVPELDEKTRGVFYGEWSIIGGESGGGKTAFAVQMALENALEGNAVGIFSLEMTKEQFKQRMYPSLSKILTANHMRDPRLMNLHTHVPEMQEITRQLARLPIYIDDSSPLRIDKLIARMRIMRRKMNIRLFLIDYLQLIRKMPKLSPAEGFEQIVFALRDFPKMENGCHLAVLSQYSKNDGFVKKKQRSKDSLYGGSIIHHAAQNILMIDIEDPEKTDNDMLEVGLRLPKQREGKKLKVNCFFDQDHLRYTQLQSPLR